MSRLHPENAPPGLAKPVPEESFPVTDHFILQRMEWKYMGTRIFEEYVRALSLIARAKVTPDNAVNVDMAIRRYVSWLKGDTTRQVSIERQQTETAEARYSQARSAFGGVPDGSW